MLFFNISTIIHSNSWPDFFWRYKIFHLGAVILRIVPTIRIFHTKQCYPKSQKETHKKLDKYTNFKNNRRELKGFFFCVICETPNRFVKRGKTKVKKKHHLKSNNKMRNAYHTCWIKKKTKNIAKKYSFLYPSDKKKTKNIAKNGLSFLRTHKLDCCRSGCSMKRRDVDEVCRHVWSLLCAPL